MATLKDCVDLITSHFSEELATKISSINSSLDKKLDKTGGEISGNLTVQGETTLVGTSRYHNAEIGLHANTFPNRDNNPTTESTDTLNFWRGKQKGMYWYNETGRLKGQPNQYGYLIHLTGTNSEVQQIFMSAPDGRIYTRGANSNGWNGNSSSTTIWHKASND